MSGNGLAGVTVHSHSPGGNLNGNVARNNDVAADNLDGDDEFAAPDDATTGVIVATAASPIAFTVVHNTIEYDTYGIWTTGPVTLTTAPPPDTYVGVSTPVGP